MLQNKEELLQLHLRQFLMQVSLISRLVLRTGSICAPALCAYLATRQLFMFTFFASNIERGTA